MFALAVLLVVAVWGYALPWLATYLAADQWAAADRQLGIDPSAIYYTEMPAQP